MDEASTLNSSESSTALPEQGIDPLTGTAADVRENVDKSLVLITSLGHAICHLGELLFPCVMIAVMLEFPMPKNHATFMALWGYVLMGVGALPIGWWVDKWDATRILFLYFLVMAVMGVAVAIAPTKLLLFCALTGLGFAASMYHPAGLAMLSMTSRARGRAMGVNGVAGSFGIAMAPIVGSAAILMGSWRWAYVGLAILSVLAALYLLPTLRTLAAAVAQQKQNSLDAQIAATRPGIPRKRNLLPLTLILGVMLLGGLNYRSLVTALPTFLMGEEAVQRDLDANDKSGNSNASQKSSNGNLVSLKSLVLKGGFMAFIVLLAGGIGQIFGGLLADRFGARNIYIVMVVSLVPLSVLLGLSGGSLIAVVFGSLLAIGMFGQQPVENSLLAEYTTTTRRSRSYALKFVLTFGIGAFGAQIVGQIWTDYHALEPVFYMITGSAVVMFALLVVFMSITRKKTA